MKTTWRAVVPEQTRATGIDRERPRASSARAIRAMVEPHMNTTSVSASSATLAGSQPGCPLTNATLEARSRCSTGMPA